MKIEHPELEEKILSVLGLTTSEIEWYWNSWYENGLLVIETSDMSSETVLDKFRSHPCYYNHYTQPDSSICIRFLIPSEHEQFFGKLVEIVRQKNKELYHTITTNMASCDKEG